MRGALLYIKAQLPANMEKTHEENHPSHIASIIYI